MRALVFTSHFPASDAPTRGTYNRALLGALSRHVDLRVVGAIPWWHRTDRLSRPFEVQRETSFGVDAAFLSYWSIPGLTPLHAGAVVWSTQRYLRAVRRQFPFELILASGAFPDAAAAAWIAERAGVPLAVNVVGSDIHLLPRSPLLRPQIARALTSARRVVAVSAEMGAAVVALGAPRERVVVQRHGVDGAAFAPRDRAEARRALGVSHEGPLFLYVGNLEEGKGVKVLVDAFGRLVRRLGRHDALLYLIGKGEAEGALRTQARALGMGEQVRFVGWQPHDQVPLWMAASDALCLPSYDEGCPNVVLEALASGRAVVASRVGGVPEILGDRTGVLVPPGDAEALARGLAEALDRTWDPLAQRASVEHLSWERAGEAYRDLLDAVVAEWREGAQTATG